MKKIIYLMVVLSLLLTFSSSVFAQVTYTNTGGTISHTGTLTSGSVVDDFAVSKNVTLIALSAPSSYSVVSSHLQGAKVYGSSSGDSVIFTLDAGKTAGAAYTTPPTNSDSSEFTSGWTVK